MLICCDRLMKKYLAFIFSVVSSFSFGQKEANIWHFGNGYSYDFNSGTAVLNTTESAMFTSEGSTSYCDEFGIYSFIQMEEEEFLLLVKTQE